MQFARVLAVNVLLALLLLCACAPERAIVDSSTSTPPVSAPSATPSPPIPTQTQAMPTSTPTTAEAVVFFQGPLSVKIFSPEDNAVLQTSPVEIQGEADPGTVIAINDAIILVDDSRSFTTQVALEPGENLLEITASDLDENQDFAFLTLLYEP